MPRAALIAIGAGSLVVALSFGIRSSFGLFLQPMSMDLGSGREVFALALAIQNLVWGASQPFFGMAADKWGTRRIVVAGGALYAFALYLMATTASAFALHLSAGLLIGLALGGTGFGVVLAAVGRAVPAEARSTALGITTAIGSFGQFLMPPVGQALLGSYGWQTTLLLMAAAALLMIVAAGGLRGGARQQVPKAATGRPWAPRSARPPATPAFSTSPPASSYAAGTSRSSRCTCRPIWRTAASVPAWRRGAWRWWGCST